MRHVVKYRSDRLEKVVTICWGRVSRPPGLGFGKPLYLMHHTSVPSLRPDWTPS